MLKIYVRTSRQGEKLNGKVMIDILCYETFTGENKQRLRKKKIKNLTVKLKSLFPIFFYRSGEL